MPESVTTETVEAMIPETLKMYDEVYGDDWLGKKIEDSTLRNIVKFYSASESLGVLLVLCFTQILTKLFAPVGTSAFFFKVSHIVAYFVCKAVQLSLKNGVCQHTPIAFLQLSNIIERGGQNVACAQ